MFKLKGSKIDVSNIFRDHLKTLVNANTNKPDISDWFSFLFLPLITAVLFTFLFRNLHSDTIALASSALSIFVGLLLNLIVLLYSLIGSPKTTELKFILIKEILNNLSFSILISSMGVLTLLLALINHFWISLAFSFISYFLVAELAVSILMIFKRMHRMYMVEIVDAEERFRKSARRDPVAESEQS